MKLSRSLKISVITFILVIASGMIFIALARKNQKISVGNIKENLALKPGVTLDSAKIRLVTQVYSHLNQDAKEFFLQGRIDALNGADTTDRMNNVTYIYTKKDKDSYFRLGNTETINENGLNVFIDHDIKKIMVSKKENLQPALPLPSPEKLISQLMDEQFVIKESFQGNTQTISFSNPYHVSCKEYALSFDRKSLNPSKILIRLSNFNQPEKSDKDNVMSFSIDKISGKAQVDMHRSSTIIYREKGRKVLSPEYSGYELINLIEQN